MGPNWARDRPAFASSVASEVAWCGAPACGPGLLVDGELGASHFHSEWDDLRPWVAIDLGVSIPVTRVVVHNRADSWGERLDRSELRIGGAPLDQPGADPAANPLVWRQASAARRAEVITVDLDPPVAGRWVSLQNLNPRPEPEGYYFLHVAEVQVYGTADLVPGRPLFSSSLAADPAWCNAPACATALVSDGDPATHFHSAEGDTAPWLSVDLGSAVLVTAVIIANRADGFGERLADAQLRLGASAAASAGGLAANPVVWRQAGPGRTGQAMRVDLGAGVAGRWLSLQNGAAGGALHIAELQVFGTQVVEAQDETGTAASTDPAQPAADAAAAQPSADATETTTTGDARIGALVTPVPTPAADSTAATTATATVPDPDAASTPAADPSNTPAACPPRDGYVTHTDLAWADAAGATPVGCVRLGGAVEAEAHCTSRPECWSWSSEGEVLAGPAAAGFKARPGVCTYVKEATLCPPKPGFAARADVWWRGDWYARYQSQSLGSDAEAEAACRRAAACTAFCAGPHAQAFVDSVPSDQDLSFEAGSCVYVKQGCARVPSWWCRFQGAVYSQADCDGDGLEDSACYDPLGDQRYVLLSGAGCEDTLAAEAPVQPSACPPAFVTPKACTRPYNWCAGAGLRYAEYDCDGDGLKDALCKDASKHTATILYSAAACKAEFAQLPATACPGLVCKDLPGFTAKPLQTWVPSNALGSADTTGAEATTGHVTSGRGGGGQLATAAQAAAHCARTPSCLAWDSAGRWASREGVLGLAADPGTACTFVKREGGGGAAGEGEDGVVVVAGRGPAALEALVPAFAGGAPYPAVEDVASE
ncbi:hypothetical protein HYH03_000027 [Edaphochlamys debaryana]|uniref:F5/8 type C domain-containing protein n=1 Tax=Edaphochlamys debaryana TaxID=47281 RepID=A0A836C645_9CHLO|nr:hypothetical protein HYH03_000027 [Edaphochlamys debaryana]|eukprot:KAG2501520.1 hypothetical protein HYH03_000027 [Edaphochlamys debaryana]